MKFIAAFVVVLHHYTQYAVGALHNSNFIFQLFSNYGGTVGVAIFFFFSGYGLMESELKSHLSPLAFFKRRFLKIYMPVILVTALWIVIYYAILRNVGISINLFDFTSTDYFSFTQEFAFGFFDPILWFIKVILVLYPAFYIFTWLRQKNEWIAWLFFATTVFIIRYLAQIWIGEFAKFSIPFFAIGVLSSEFKRLNWNILNISLIPIVLYGIIELSLGVKYTLFLCTIISLIIIIFTAYKPKLACPALIAALSFDIYLVHYKIFLSLREVMPGISLCIFLIFTAIGGGYFLLHPKIFNTPDTQSQKQAFYISA